MANEHAARVECAERLAALEVHLRILDEVREEVRDMDSRLGTVEAWVEAQNGTLQTVRDQVVAILRALDVFQQHSKDFEEDMRRYREVREEKEKAEREAREAAREAALEEAVKAQPAAAVPITKLALAQRVIELRATWLIVGIIITLALLLGAEFWADTARRYMDHKLPAVEATPTPGPAGVH